MTTSPLTSSAAVTRKIRLLVADDHHVVRRGLVAVLNAEADLQVIADAADGQSAVDLFERERPDIALLDLRMPRLDGLGAIQAIRAKHPDARIILLTTFDADEGIYQAMRAGAKAYLLKDATPEELADCIRKVNAGRTWLPPALAERLAERMSAPELTERESEVLTLMAEGKSNKEIGARLFISEATVKTHVTNLLAKLGVTSRTEAITTATKRGLVQI